jgi:pimeloyl-ACP methyl ester carboxylesterase
LGESIKTNVFLKEHKMTEGKVKANNIDIWYEDFGNSSNPTVLLIMGAGAQGIMWNLELIRKIVNTGYHVVRFDNRDAGLSTWIDDFNANPYSLEDMAADTIGLMDALNIKKAHIIGWSMGGMIAQLIAIHYPNRILSLTSWMSTYWSLDPDVPAMSDEITSWFEKSMGGTPPETKEKIVEENVKIFRMFSGSRFPFNEQWLKSMTEESYDRGWDPRTTQNHVAATMASPSRLEALKNLNIRTLVIHGTEDPIINYVHGVVCAKVIPRSRLLTLKGVGHEIPSEIVSEAVEAILKHIGES